MKKLLIYTLLVTLLLPLGVAEASPALSATPETTVAPNQTTIFKRKRKGFRQKKGFMWGLFKKNDCGCPKH